MVISGNKKSVLGIIVSRIHVQAILWLSSVRIVIFQKKTVKGSSINTWEIILRRIRSLRKSSSSKFLHNIRQVSVGLTKVTRKVLPYIGPLLNKP